jgi:hypothetical protein
MVTRMVRLRLAAIFAGAFFVFLPAASQGQTGAILTGRVGPEFTITLRDASGAAVQHLDPGTYTVNVSDLGDIHNFHLFGPGVDQSTDIAETGNVTWRVTFRDGIYTYRCDPHLTSMRGRFTVGSATLPTPVTVTRLSGRVGPGATIRLTNAAGKRVTRVKAGRYRIAVRDASGTESFHLSGPGVNRKTGVRFRGTTTWTVNLKAGRYTYRSDVTKKLRGVLVVTAATSAHAGHGQ